MRNVLIICQARMGSTRLPGKINKKVLNKPIIWYLIKRLELVRIPHKLIIAIGDSKSNQPLIDFVKTQNIDYYVGSEENVLERYYNAAKKFNGDVIARITSDCPLSDPEVIDKGLEIFLNGEYDYVSNVNPETYPDGINVEIFSMEVLERIWIETKDPYEKEHVTLYITNNQNKFKIANFEYTIDLSNFRFSLDTMDDFLFLSKVIKEFHNKWGSFRMKDLIIYLKENPELLKINSQYERNINFLKSLDISFI